MQSSSDTYTHRFYPVIGQSTNFTFSYLFPKKLKILTHHTKKKKSCFVVSLIILNYYIPDIDVLMFSLHTFLFPFFLICHACWCNIWHNNCYGKRNHLPTFPVLSQVLSNPNPNMISTSHSTYFDPSYGYLSTSLCTIHLSWKWSRYAEVESYSYKTRYK